MTKSLLLLFLLTNTAWTQSDDIQFFIDALTRAKLTGMCGGLKQMTAFQESTKMQGGDEFILRFIQTEAARLGVDVQTLLANCKNTVDQHNSLMQSLSDSQ